MKASPVGNARTNEAPQTAPTGGSPHEGESGGAVRPTPDPAAASRDRFSVFRNLKIFSIYDLIRFSFSGFPSEISKYFPIYDLIRFSGFRFSEISKYFPDLN